ncbi:MAG: putative AlkP superfamily pyrophosphatase or phosphodiesterase [Planctomycetota bacterium]|jgi:predicted AlkP superfamily pyrophosphatase or phosphodiesterase
MQPVLLLDVVGLTQAQISPEITPHLHALGQRGSIAPMDSILPAVTCSAQATMLTGTMPSEHGVVGNGWRDPKSFEVALWRQSNALVRGEKVYEAAKKLDPSFTCAKLFWWWNMGAAVDLSITPRPFYPADGRKIPAIYAWPPEFGEETEAALGKFPFFDFWGPKAGLPSSRWIADAAIRTLREKRPTLTMAYLPHLDYDHQRFGPKAPRSIEALREIDVIVGDLVAAADETGAAVIVVSEYGITEVSKPVHLNLALRKAGLLHARKTPNGDVLDPFGSRAFALVDHQIAHIYTQDDAATAEARRVLEGVDGVQSILDAEGQRAAGLDHPNSGDLVVQSDPDAWFTYYYWEDPAAEPDFARTVDIHRKPGYDPLEMFLDPGIKVPMLRVARRLAQKKLGFRYLMDLIPTDATLIRGSHGLVPEDPAAGPVWLSSLPFSASSTAGPQGTSAPGDSGTIPMTSVKARVLAALQRPD